VKAAFVYSLAGFGNLLRRTWFQDAVKNDCPEVLRVVAGVLLGGVILAVVPQAWVDGPFGRAPGNMAVSPPRVDSGWILGRGVRRVLTVENTSAIIERWK
jgi:hypothetical protein